MTDLKLLLMTLAALLVLGVSEAALAGDDDDEFVSDRALICLAPGATIEQFNHAFGTTTIDAIPERGVYLVDLPDGADEEMFEDIADLSPLVDEVDLDFIGRTGDPFGDTRSIFTGLTAPRLEDQHAMGLMNLRDAGDLADGGGVLVALIDGGVDAAHPVLLGRVVPGYNFVLDSADTRDIPRGVNTNADPTPDELVGHGTFVAGLIATVAPGAKIMPLVAMDSDGRATVFDVVRALYAAIDAGADVVNISMSTVGDTGVLADAIEEAESRGVIVVASVGNTGLPEVRFPAGHESSLMIGVAATDAGDSLAVFSTYGETVTLTAPGVGLVSTLPVGWLPPGPPTQGRGPMVARGVEYGRASGTSFAAPLVTGSIALLRGLCPGLTPEQACQMVITGVHDNSAENPGLGGQIGAGRLDLEAPLLGLGTPPLACSADLDGDGRVTIEDRYMFAHAPRDLDLDGAADADDAALIEWIIRRFE